jgi:dihydroneopterin aldolase
VLDTPATETDALAHTVDYGEAAECVREVSDAHAYTLLEALAAACAEALLARFRNVTSVRVRVRKPDVQLGDPVAFAAVTVRRARA